MEDEHDSNHVEPKRINRSENSRNSEAIGSDTLPLGNILEEIFVIHVVRFLPLPYSIHILFILVTERNLCLTTNSMKNTKANIVQPKSIRIQPDYGPHSMYIPLSNSQTPHSACTLLDAFAHNRHLYACEKGLLFVGSDAYTLTSMVAAS